MGLEKEGEIIGTNKNLIRADITKIYYKNMDIKSVESYAFQDTIATEVELNMVSNIEVNTFANNLNLETFKANIVGMVGARAFEHCVLLKNVDIKKAYCIREYAFRGCKSLKSIKLPEGIAEIGLDAFEGCPIKSVYIPKSVCSICGSSFDDRYTKKIRTDSSYVFNKLKDGHKWSIELLDGNG